MTVEERARPLSDVYALEYFDHRVEWDRTVTPMLVLVGALVVAWALYFTITEAPRRDQARHVGSLCLGTRIPARLQSASAVLGLDLRPVVLVFPRTGWAFALLSSVNAGIGLWGAWMLIGDFAEGRKRMTAWALLLLTPLYTFYAYKYNANIIFLSIWPWTLHYFVRSVQGRRLSDAIALGALIGLAMISKYYALILVADVLPRRAPASSRAGRYFASASPYVRPRGGGGLRAARVVAADPPRAAVALSGSPYRIRIGRYLLGHAGDTLLGVVAMNLKLLLSPGGQRGCPAETTGGVTIESHFDENQGGCRRY